ncbi:hypothetical protein FACS1894208_09710 [Clostridia bacterium]|nr:hypothetical protein FACS1894208_09710 [Clostridia bacterium]
MTDKQMAFVVTLMTDKIESCKTMEEVKKACEELKAIVLGSKSSAE